MGKKKKKVRILQEDIKKKAALLEQEGRSIESYLVKELDMLLGWHKVTSPTGWKKANKLKEWWHIMASGKPLLYKFNWWTDEEEEWLVSLSADMIDIRDVAYRPKISLKQRELKAAAENNSQEKRVNIRKKLDEINMEEAISPLVEMDTSSQECSEVLLC